MLEEDPALPSPTRRTCDGISITVVLCGSLRTRIIIIGRRQALNHLQLVIQKRSRRRMCTVVINGANWI